MSFFRRRSSPCSLRHFNAFTLVYSTVEAEDQVGYVAGRQQADESGEKSLYQLVFDEIPASMRRSHPRLRPPPHERQAIDLVRRFQVDGPESRMSADCPGSAAQAHDLGRRYGRDESDVAEVLRGCLRTSDLAYPIEGAILCWEPYDAIHGLFDEDSQSRAQGYGFMPFACLEINMRSRRENPGCPRGRR